jgi:DNA replication and repair protein RecF
VKTGFSPLFLGTCAHSHHQNNKFLLSLGSIALYQFKNYTNRGFEFNQRIIGICGNNGVGKTNLLDAIHYLCFTKSYFSRIDAGNVQQGRKGFRIEGEFSLNGKTEKTACILRETGKKEFSVNGQPYDKFSEHIGRYPCVIIAPDDAVLITGGSEERRRFIDSLLSQLDAEYLQHLITYMKILQQRNSFLKSFHETGGKAGRRAGHEDDLSLLDVLDEQLLKPGEYIFARRKEFMVSFLPQVKHLYNEIANQQEDLTLLYDSQLLATSFSELLVSARQKDIYTGRTTSGIHRDELEFSLGIQPFRNIASQGQRKSLLFALKLAEMEVLYKDKGFPPLLLLDDVFEKLDESRINNLLEKVCVKNEGQVFITDTNEERLREHLVSIGASFEIIVL